ncbi:hypothetical protein Tco_1369443 [Tanacetum coccineum]
MTPHQASKKMKKWADEMRSHVEFEVGDQVMVKLLPQQFKSLRKVHKGLIQGFFKPYHGDEDDPKRGVSKRAPTIFVTLYDREVKEILSDLKQVGKRKTYCGSFLTRSRDITRTARRGRRELRRLSGILWMVEEGLGSPWKIIEALRNPISFYPWRVVEYGPYWSCKYVAIDL